MKTLLARLIVACALASSLSPSRASEPNTSGGRATDDEQRLLDLESSWTNAEIKRDAGALRRILDDHFVVTFGGGKPYDKEGFIKSVVEDTDTMTSQDLTDRTVHMDRDTAVVLETDSVSGTSDGKPFTVAYRIT